MNNDNIIFCENCNKEFVKNKRIKNHRFCSEECKKEYYKKNPKEESVICSNCKVQYTRRKQGRYDNNYCSLNCEKTFKHNQKWEFRSCDICSKEYECKKISTQKLCSIECQGKWQSLQIGVLNPRFTSVLVFCDFCGVEYYQHLHRQDYGGKRFCGTKCRQTWYAEVWSQTEEWKEESKKRTVLMLEDGSFNHTNTGIQVLVNNILEELNISYVNEKGFVYFAVDNYLDKYNLIIEVMGGFWHCDPRTYSNVNQEIQVTRIKNDKAKHTYIKNNHNIEILYIWEYDINSNINLVKKLIKLYVDNLGILENYHSFNYELINNNLIISESLIIPYMEYEKSVLDNIIDITIKEQMSRKDISKWTTFNCEYCNAEKEELTSHYNKKASHFCSMECYGKSKQKRTSVVCTQCNGDFHIKNSLFNTSKTKRFFCTQTCQHKYQKEVGFKRNGGVVTFNCDNCGIESLKETGEFNRNKHHFCSKECNYTFKRNKGRTPHALTN